MQTDEQELATGQRSRSLARWVVLVGRLARRYVASSLPPGTRPHVGTTEWISLLSLVADEGLRYRVNAGCNLRGFGRLKTARRSQQT